MKHLLIYVLSFILFISCKSENHTQETFQVDVYQELISSLIPEQNIHSLDDVDINISKIQKFISSNPNHEQTFYLKELIEQLESSKSELVFNEYKNEVKKTFNDSFNSYEQGIKSYKNLLQISNEVKQYFNDSIKLQEVNQVVNTINTNLSQIEGEKSEYNYLIENPTSNNLDYFLNQYPNSIMKNTLIEKKDEILINEYFENSKANFNTIQELNSEISTVRSYMAKIQSVEYKSKLKEIERDLESNRRNILEIELQDNLSRLISAMESKARRKAEGAHFNASVETCSPRGNNPEVIGYRSTFERQYLVYTKSGTWVTGMKKRELIITVTGEITGDLQSGVNYNITGSRIDSDRVL